MIVCGRGYARRRRRARRFTVVNHQSFADLIAMCFLEHPTKYIGKASVFDVPVYSLVFVKEAVITVRVLDPLPTETRALGDTEHLLADVRAQMVAAHAQMESSPSPGVS